MQKIKVGDLELEIDGDVDVEVDGKKVKVKGRERVQFVPWYQPWNSPLPWNPWQDDPYKITWCINTDGSNTYPFTVRAS